MSLATLPLSLSLNQDGRVWMVDAEHRLFQLSPGDRAEEVPVEAGVLMGAAPRDADDLWLLVRGGDGKNRLATWRPGGAAPELVELPVEPMAMAPAGDTGLLIYIAADRSLHRLRDGTSAAMGDIRCNAVAASPVRVVCVRHPDSAIVHTSPAKSRWCELRPARPCALAGLAGNGETVLLRLEPWRKGEEPPDSTVLGVSLAGDERVILTGRVAMAAASHSHLAAVVLDPGSRLSVELYNT